MMKILWALTFLALAGAAQAQPYSVVTSCDGITIGSGQVGYGNTGYIDLTGHICGSGTGGTFPTVPAAFRGNGTLSVSASALINTMTVNSSGAALPATLGNFTVIANTGDVAFCAAGGLCTCPANGAAVTNGDTVKAGGGSYTYYLPSTASSTPTVVSCSGTAIVEFQW